MVLAGDDFWYDNYGLWPWQAKPRPTMSMYAVAFTGNTARLISFRSPQNCIILSFFKSYTQVDKAVRLCVSI